MITIQNKVNDCVIKTELNTHNSTGEVILIFPKQVVKINVHDWKNLKEVLEEAAKQVNSIIGGPLPLVEKVKELECKTNSSLI